MYGATVKPPEPSSNSGLSRWRMCCFPYKVRGFRNKGGFLILLWGVNGFLISFYFLQVANPDMKIAFVCSLMFYPVAGWLADVYYGRYKVIRHSMRMGLVAAMVYNLFLIENQWLHDKIGQRFCQVFESLLAVIALVVFSGFQANIVQFGIDQFIVASSLEISSYISWFVWMIFLSRCIIVFSQIGTCVCDNTKT